MNFLEMNKAKKLYRTHTEHVQSFPLSKVPKGILKDVPIEEWNFIKDMPFVRLNESRVILINEDDSSAEIFLDMFITLDHMPDWLLFDVRDMYTVGREDVSIENVIMDDNTGETRRRFLLLLAPEILWTRGYKNVDSKIFHK